MSSIELVPWEESAEIYEITRYQRKVGSILYAAVITRPDIAFVVLRLARFLINPGSNHQIAAGKVLLYQQNTQGLALQLGGEDNLIVAVNF